MSKACISVVIPAFNREREVGRAIESCLGQGFTDFQIVVVDDGSRDRTSDAVRSYPDERICLVRHPANRGECPARNTGVAHATAAWVLFLDSDDELLPDAMGTIAAKTRSCPRDIARLVFCFRRDDGQVSPSPQFQQEVFDYEAYVRWTNNLQFSDFLQCVRRETFDHVRFPENRMHELPYHFDFSRRFKTRFYPEVLAKLHQDAAGRESEWQLGGRIKWGGGNAVDRAEGMVQLLDKHAKALRENAPHSLEVYSRMRATYRFLAADRTEGLRMAVQHLARYPFSIHSWVIPALGVMGFRALLAGTRLRAWAVESRGWGRIVRRPGRQESRPLIAQTQPQQRAAPFRILHVLGRMERAGAELRTVDLMRELGGRYQFEFCALSGLHGQLDDEITALGGKVHLEGLGPAFPGRFRNLLRQGGFDAVHSHVHYFSGYVLRLAAKERVPVRIAHFRSTHDGRGTGWHRLAYRTIMKHWLDRYATHILAVSRACMDLTWDAGWTSDARCKVIYDGIDTLPFDGPADREGVRQEFDLPADCKLIVHVGRMDAPKNHERLISIFRHIAVHNPDARLLLVGRGGNEVEMRVRTLVSEFRLDQRVLFLGVRADVPRLLKAADLLLLPSLWEGLAGAVLEAAAAGLPVVASDLSALREVCQYVAGIDLLSLDQPDAEWAEAVEGILQQPGGRSIRRIADFAATPFTVRTAAKEFETCLGMGESTRGAWN